MKESLTLPSVREAAAAGMAALAVGGALHANQAEAAAAHAHAPATAEAAASNSRLPETVQKVMKRDTALLTELNCTAALIRETPTGPPIAALTAQHCGLTNEDNPRITSGGKTYIIQKRTPKAQTGDTAGHLKDAMTIGSYILPEPAAQPNQNQYDIAIALAKGVSPARGLAAVRKQMLTEPQIHNLKQYSDIYLSGWPVTQFNNHGSLHRQQFDMKLIGLGRTTTTKTKNTAIVQSVVNSTKEGATTSYGDSGGAGFVMVHGQPKYIGVLSSFEDLNLEVPGTPNADPTTKSEHLNGPDASAISGLAYKLRTPGHGGEVVYSVQSERDIPGYLGPEQATQNARDAILSGKPKTVLRGDINLPLGAGTMMRQKGGPAQVIIKNPMLDASSKIGVVFSWVDPTKPGNLDQQFVSNKELSSMPAFGASDGTPASLALSTGAFTVEAATDTQPADALDDQGRHLGAVSTTEIPNYSMSNYIVATNGQLSLVPYQGKG